MGSKKFSTKNSFLVQLICVDKNNLVMDQNIFRFLEGQGIRFSPQAKSIGLEQTTINPCVKKDVTLRFDSRFEFQDGHSNQTYCI